MAKRFLTIALLFACLALADTGAAAVNLRVGYYENSPVFFSEDGKPRGLAIDIISKLAELNGWNCRFIPATREECVEKLGTGELDVVPALPFSYDYPSIRYTTSSLIADWATIFTDSISVSNLQDLEDFRIGYVKDDPHAEVFKVMAGNLGVAITLVRFDDHMEVLQAISDGKVQAGIASRLFGLRHAEAMGVKASAILFNPVSLRIAVSANTPSDIYEKLDLGLEDLKEDKTSYYHLALAQWLTSESSLSQWINPTSVTIFFFVILGQVVAFFWFQRRLADTTTKADRQEEALKEETKVRKQAQSALWESVERHRAMFTDNRLPQVVVDSETYRILEANPAANEYYGFSAGKLTSLRVQDINASDPTMLNMLMTDVVQGKSHAVTRHRLADGRVKDVELFISPLYIHDHQHLLMTVVDISERMAAERARRASEERLDLAVKGGNLAFWDWDVESGTFVFSDQYAIMLGLPPGGIGARLDALLEKVHPDDAERVQADFRNCLEAEDGSHLSQFRIRNKSGELRWFMSRGRVSQRTHAGRPLRVTGIANDITERKQTQDRLTSINNAFLAFSPNPDENIAGLTTLAGRELDGCAAFYSRVAMNTLKPHSEWNTQPEDVYGEIGPGHLSHELLGRNVNGMFLLNNLQSSKFLATDPDVEGLGLQTYLGQIIRVAGKAVGVLSVLFKENYTPTGSDEMTYGIIAAALAIEEERSIAARALVKAKDEAESANRAKSEFLANMSHEIRTPLNGIFGMLQLVGETRLDDNQRDFVNTALTSGRSLLRVINDVLDFSKMEAGMLALENSPFDFRQMVKSVLDNFRVQAAEKNLELGVDIDDSVPSVILGDEARLRQILFNLVGNGVKFTREGQVSVESWVFRSEKWKRKLRLYMTVRDTGIGIPDNMLESVFKAFSQVDGSYTREYGGTGLGLGIVRRLVSLMGGEIAVVSDGEGTRIHLFVDVSEASGVSLKSDISIPPSVRIDPMDVLLVEDERVNRMVVKRHLESLGHTVTEAGDGKQALELLKWNDFDVVLMDVQMPKMDGMTATRHIREDEAFKARADIPVVALTAHAMKGDRDKFLASGMDDYLAKPVEFVDLVSVLANLNGRIRRRKQGT